MQAFHWSAHTQSHMLTRTIGCTESTAKNRIEQAEKRRTQIVRENIILMLLSISQHWNCIFCVSVSSPFRCQVFGTSVFLQLFTQIDFFSRLLRRCHILSLFFLLIFLRLFSLSTARVNKLIIDTFYGVNFHWRGSFLLLFFSKLIFASFLGVLLGGLGGFGVTGGAHRFWTHRSYKANIPMRIILMICFTMSGQNTIYEWVRDHRVHHKFSETDADPHNSNRGFFFAHVGWLMMHKHPEVLRKGRMLDMSDINEDPVVQFHQK